MKFIFIILLLSLSMSINAKEKYLLRADPEKQSVREVELNKQTKEIKEDTLSIKKIDTVTFPKLSGAISSGRTCFTILQKNKTSPNGIYTISPSDIPFNTYCDMKNGGWSLLSVQTPSELLSSNINDINIHNFGNLNKTHRVGNQIINSIRPYFSWKMEDSENIVYFRPHCIIHWSNDLNNTKLSYCNQGYKSENFDKLISEANLTNYSNGIGVSNEGKYCSIRMYLSRNIFDKNEKVLIKKGTAFNCSGNSNSIIRLWFK